MRSAHDYVYTYIGLKIENQRIEENLQLKGALHQEDIRTYISNKVQMSNMILEYGGVDSLGNIIEEDLSGLIGCTYP